MPSKQPTCSVSQKIVLFVDTDVRNSNPKTLNCTVYSFVFFIDLIDLRFLRSSTEKTKSGRYRNGILREEMEIHRCLNKSEIKKNYNGVHMSKELVYQNMLWSFK
jgi:hypothetical protein